MAYDLSCATVVQLQPVTEQGVGGEGGGGDAGAAGLLEVLEVFLSMLDRHFRFVLLVYREEVVRLLLQEKVKVGESWVVEGCRVVGCRVAFVGVLAVKVVNPLVVNRRIIGNPMVDWW